MTLLLELREYAADHGAPYWLRMVLARPHAYQFARAWHWPRRHALGCALAPLFGRDYRHEIPTRHWTHPLRLADEIDGRRS